MKKSFIVLACSVLFASTVFAYNPPFGGEDVYSFSSPEFMTGSASAAGGPLFTVLPGSIVYNPALTSLEQRTVINLSYSGMFDKEEDRTDYGQSFQVGVAVPTRYCVLTGVIHGAGIELPKMDMGKIFVLHLGVSKDVTEKLSVGTNIYSGFYFGRGSDFTTGVDFGALYSIGSLGFLNNAKVGVSLLNLGKPLKSGSYMITGINGTSEGVSYPGIATPRLGFAADFFGTRNFTGSFSTDVYFPTFQNAVFALGLGFNYKDMLKLTCSWDANIRELIESGSEAINLPSVGVTFKWVINTNKMKIGESNWEESEVVASASWKNECNGVQVISGGAALYLGLKDTSAPEIYLWDEEFFDEE